MIYAISLIGVVTLVTALYVAEVRRLARAAALLRHGTCQGLTIRQRLRCVRTAHAVTWDGVLTRHAPVGGHIPPLAPHPKEPRD